MTDSEIQPVLLGRIEGLYGVKGWVKVFSYTKPREAILNYDHWLVLRNDQWRPLALLQGKRHGKSVIACLEGIEDRDAAAGLLGCDVGVARGDLPDIESGRYYWTDLEGMKVVDRGGDEIGKVAYVMETGANDVLVTVGERERLIPFVADKVILDVDLANGVITVDWDWD